ncbi:MAG: cytochrome c [Hyphomicrobiales bacterium]|nr:cytochrome c [Hyphomicrobiales bacterium]
MALAAIALTFFVGPKASNAQEARLGTEEYDNSCAICHGPDGKGDGPFGMFLNIKPADLTVLAKNNNGEYPFLRVFESIDGRTQTPGHGDSVMPIWGDRYEIQTDVQPGTYGSELMVRSRILELVYFIQTIQAK